MTQKTYVAPNPIVDKKESEKLVLLTEEYNKLLQPGKVESVLKKVEEKVQVPEQVTNAIDNVKNKVSESEMYAKAFTLAVEYLSELYEDANKAVSKVTLSDKVVIKALHAKKMYPKINSIDELCLVRSYDISKIVNLESKANKVLAAAEGGLTGFLGGIKGLALSIVTSTLLYYRVVQSIALAYGYDVKHDENELYIASYVTLNAMSPSKDNVDEMSSLITKVLVTSELATVKQTAKKTWTDMVQEGGITLLLANIRALSNAGVRKTVANQGKTIEFGIFEKLLKQLGDKLTKENIGKYIPGVGVIFGASIDYSQMKSIIAYATIFYEKRFIGEKEVRVAALIEKAKDDRKQNLIESQEDKILSIAVETASEFNVDPEDIFSNKRSRDVLLARKVSVYLVKRECDLSSDLLARQFSLTTDTINKYLNSIESLLTEDKELKTHITRIRRSILKQST